MLNPNATEFRPLDPPKSSSHLPAKEDKQKDKKKQASSRQQPSSSATSPQESESRSRSSQRTSDGKRRSHGKAKKGAPSSSSSSGGGGSGRRPSGRRESSIQANNPASGSTPEPFDQPVKFITIEEVIDPVFRTRSDTRDNSAAGDDGRARGKLVHGYERYIEWMSRCLKTYDTITIVGMDKAIADVVSLVTILQHRGIGEHEEVETFTVEQDVRRHLPIANNNLPSPDATELTQVRGDIESLLATLDARHNLHSVTSLETGSSSSNDDESSVSSNMSVQDKAYYTDDDDPIHGHTFYGEDGRDEAQQRLFHGDLENGNDDNDNIPAGKNFRKNSRWICIAFLGALLLGWIIWTFVVSGISQVHVSEEEQGAKHIDFDDLYNTSFTPKRPFLEWVKNDPRDGVFTYSDPLTGDILLETIEQGTVDTLVKQSYLQLDDGYLEVSSFEISQDAEYLMLWTNVSSQWRYSVRANVYIYNIANRTLVPLTENSTVYGPPRISYAVWSPTGHQVAYVMDNDLYVTDLVTERRVTFDGSATIFNGVPDWVYEEEVFAKDNTLWWSPDSTHIAYLRFNETAVPEYHVPFYTKSNSTYPDEVSIKYPKAGAPNPLVSLHIYSLLDDTTIMVTKNSTAESVLQMIAGYQGFEDEDRLITDVVWATETHTHLLFKQMNRVQDYEITSLVTVKPNANESTVQLARKYQPKDGGWIEVQQSIVYLSTKNEQIRYIDLADDGNGYLHLAIFTANDAKKKPIWLTSGEWEVVTGTVVMDPVRQLLHFASTERSPLERHLYSISLKDKNPASTKVCLTCPKDPEEHAYYTASFSPKAGYYVLNYEGPDVPKTVVKKVDNGTFESVLEDNQNLRALLSGYELPRPRMVTVQSGGVEMNAVELLPPDFNAAEKYPVLFHVYGGPGSQLVSYQFDLSWHTFIASKLRYIVVTVDGRGTGFRGREYRTCVRKRLGELETIDQVNAAKHWATLNYVDPSRIAIWGWSYGGYMTSKVIESNDGVFSTGMAVAPVTDWRYYDSIYTERYMLTPEMNPDGYTKSAVNNMTGFENAQFLLVHGTGDDNVHFQHSAVLVDKLTRANVHNYRVQFYSDNNHAIRYHDANSNLYYLLTEYLWESFGGREYMHVRAETHGRFAGPLQDH